MFALGWLSVGDFLITLRVVLAFVIRNASGLPLAASPATREREKREREGDEVTAKYSPLVVARALLP